MGQAVDRHGLEAGVAEGDLVKALGGRIAGVTCLDTKTSREIIDLFRRLNQEFGLTIVLVTHDHEVARHAKRAIVLRDGLITCDTTDFRQAAQAVNSASYLDDEPVQTGELPTGEQASAPASDS